MSLGTETDLLIAAIARELVDGDRLHVGANQIHVAVAAQLARRLWAPHLLMNVAGNWLLGLERDLEIVGRCAYETEVVDARSATFWQARVFDDLRRAPIVFGGGLQIDARGNANLIGIRRNGGTGWRLRGPGSAGLPTLTTFAPRFYLVALQHDRRSLVDAVSDISVLGDPVERERLGLHPFALRAVLTPLARFEPTRQGLELTELSEGVDRDEVAERTGFEVHAARQVRTRPGLTDDERAVLAEVREAVERNQALVA